MSKAISVSEFAKQVRDGKPAPVYLALGNEPLLFDEVAGFTLELVDETTRDFNFDSYSGDELAVDTIASSVNELPMMAERRVILVKRAESLTPKIQNFLTDYVKNPSEDSVLVMLMEGDIKAKWKQTLVKQVTTIRCETPQRGELLRWILDRANSLSLTIADEALSLMTESREVRLIDLAGELEKASLLLGEGGTLSLDVLQTIWGMEPEVNIWTFFDRVVSGRMPDVWREFKYLETEFEKDSRQAGFILSQVGRRFRLVAKEREYDMRRVSPGSRSWSGKTETTWRMMSRQVKSMPLDAAQRGIDSLRQLDRERKTTSKKAGRMFERFMVEHSQRCEKASR